MSDVRRAFLTGMCVIAAACSVDERSLGSQQDASSDTSAMAEVANDSALSSQAADGAESGAVVDISSPSSETGSSDGARGDSTRADDAAVSSDDAFDGDANTSGDANTDGDANIAGDGAVTNPLRDGCTLLLHMEEPAWSGVAGEVIDSSGFGNHGTASGTATTIADGKFGRAGSFDGNGWVTVHDSPSLRPTTALTYAAWIYPTGLEGTRSPGIISKRTGFGVDTAFTMFIWINNQLYVDIEGEGNRFAAPTVYQNNQWYFVAVVFDGSLVAAQRARVYVNGGLDTAANEDVTSIGPHASDVTIGNLVGGGNTFIGRIDEVMVWKRALSGGEIATLYAMTHPL